MAKKYTKFFQIALETHYGNGVAPLINMATTNAAVKFTPFLPNETRSETTDPTYIIQRLKRAKAKDSPYDKTKGEGTNLIAMLDAADKIDWTTLETKRGKERYLAVRIPQRQNHYESANEIATNANAFGIILADKAKNRLIEAEEKAIAKIVAATTPALVDMTKAKELGASLATAARTIQMFVDDYKAYSSNIVAFIHPLVRDILIEYEGVNYHGARDTFSIAPDTFSYKGINFIVSPLLNTQTTANKETIVAIVMDREAYAHGGLMNDLTLFAQQTPKAMVMGHLYSDIDIVVDPLRIKTFMATTASLIPASAKVNA